MCSGDKSLGEVTRATVAGVLTVGVLELVSWAVVWLRGWW